MASFEIEITRSAEKQLARVPTTQLRRVVDAIQTLASNPLPKGVRKLAGYDDVYRIRVGRYRVLYSVASANRDEGVFENADQFRVDRVRPAVHLGFGYGKHFCVGAPLARMEAEEAMNAFFDRFEAADIRLAKDFKLEWMPMPYMLGPLRLDIEIR